MKTIDDVDRAIRDLVAERSRKAAASPYDWKVCVGAVAAARETIDAIPLAGEPRGYLAAVIAAISALQETYFDPDGEYTSGASEIGSLAASLSQLQEQLSLAPMAD